MGLFGGMPFFLGLQGKNIKMNWTRLLESFIIMAGTAMLTSQITMAKIQVQVQNIETNSNQTRMQVDKLSDKIIVIMEKQAAIDTLQQELIRREALKRRI
jgi:uncharacterized protein YggE